MKKKAAALVAMLCVCLLFPIVAWAADTDIVKNSDFEYVGTDGMPEGWRASGYQINKSATVFLHDTEVFFSGHASVSVENIQENDARFEQTVPVEPNTTYKISCYIRAEGISRGKTGANISLLNCWGSSNPVYDTNGGWERAEAYVQTGLRDKTMTIALRIGAYSSENTGKAWFDSVSVEQVASAPYGETVLKPYQFEMMNLLNNPDVMFYFSMVGVLLGGVLLLVLYQKGLLVKKSLALEEKEDNYGVTVLLVLAIGFLVRLIVLQLSPGYRFDMGCFAAWAQRASTMPLADFYDASGQFFCDYPPGYLYFLAGIGHVASLFGITADSVFHGMLLRLPACVADTACAFLLYRFACRDGRMGKRSALVIASLYLFNPAPIFDAAAWGQMDGVLALSIVAGMMLLCRKQYVWAAVLFAFGATLKPQGLIFLPVLVYPIIGDLFPSREERLLLDSKALRVSRRKTLLRAAAALVTGLAVFALIVAPFIVKLGPSFIVEKYQETITSYPYLSVNAANLWGALGMNWEAIPASSATWTVVTYAVIALAIAGSAWVYFRSRKAEGLVMSALVLLLTIFLLSTQMHERYAFTALALLLMALALTRDRRMFWCMLGLSITMSLNMMLCMFTVHIPADDPLFLIVSVAQVLLVAAVFVVVFLVVGRQEIRPLEEKIREEEADGEPVRVEKVTPLMRLHAYETPQRRMKLTMRDWAIMLLVTLVYAGVALTNLGDTKASQTFWKSEKTGEAFVVDLGAARHVEHVFYYAGIGEGKLFLAYSQDGNAWKDLVEIDNKYGDMYCWKPLQTGVEARFVRVEVKQKGMVLYEMAFKDEAHRTLPIVNVEHIGAAEEGDNPVALAFDEQHLVPEIPTYMNSMYFDEIYHARTAYEHLHQMPPYETTHPPLGKVIIMAGIALFGMTPFGWRIAGAVAGIIMVPVVFLLAKRFFKKTRWAAVATVLLTFDFMHYAQTRIATIDSYAVLFIMLMYWFMYRFVTMNMHKERLIDTLKPLALSGLFFGLGAASKWICIYAGGGLLVLFVIALMQRVREYRAAMRVPQEEWGEHEALYASMRKRFGRDTVLTMLWCFLWFIVIPMAIYVASYYPSVIVDGYGWQYVLNNQGSMFSYHSKLTEGHSFGSPWYEWPLMFRPIWFFDAPLLPKGLTAGISSFGNPAVWWAGFAALIWAIYRGIRDGWHKGWEKWLVVIGFATQFLPWVLVSRTTFIYHYFASVPFIILAIVLFLRDWVEKNPARMKWVWLYCGIAIALFALFYPVLTGTPMALWYGRLLRWMPSWILFRG